MERLPNYDNWKLATPYSDDETCEDCGFVDCECEKPHDCKHCADPCDCETGENCMKCSECHKYCENCGNLKGEDCENNSCD